MTVILSPRRARLPRFLAPVAAGAAAALLAGCGSGPPALSARASQELQAQVQAVRAAALSHDPARVNTELGRLRADVSGLRASGQVSASRANAILAAATGVEQQLPAITTTTTTTTTTAPPTTTTSTARPPDHPGDGGPGPAQGGRGDGHGHGHGGH